MKMISKVAINLTSRHQDRRNGQDIYETSFLNR